MAAFSSLAIAGLALTAIGTGVSIYSQQQQGKVAANAAEANAKMAQQQAANLDLENRENIRRQRIENQRLLSRQRAGFAASGVQIGTGTPLEVQAETAGILELDLLDQNRASQIQQSNLFYQASADRASAANYRSAANLNSAGSLFSGAASIGGSYYGMSRQGVFSSTGSTTRTY
jgi:hypothetical protein